MKNVRKLAKNAIYVTGRCIKEKIIENVYKINKYRHRQKMAIFDYDWTLVKPKSNGTFAKNENDWVKLTEKVPIIIKELYDKGYSINIISNQRKNTITKIKEINNALSSLNIPIIYVIGKDKIIAKPNKSIFDLLLNNKKWDKNKSFYVGDALGRKEDWSDVDKKFAENIDVKYYSPDVKYLQQLILKVKILRRIKIKKL